MVLRNRFQEIRDVARGTLIKILETLGCRYLQYLLKEMQGILVKGYQVKKLKCFQNIQKDSYVILRQKWKCRSLCLVFVNNI